MDAIKRICKVQELDLDLEMKMFNILTVWPASHTSKGHTRIKLSNLEKYQIFILRISEQY